MLLRALLLVHTSCHMCRYAWDQLAEAEEVADDYGLGARDSLQDAVEAVIAILGMKVRAELETGCGARPCRCGPGV